jgi:hypothetical protein
MVVRFCRVDMSPPCSWDPHNFKHFPFAGMTREHTHNANPARYLPSFARDRIRTLEAATARTPDRWCGRIPLKTEYLRDMVEAIGWDKGQDATLSFVECTGGEVARSLHGRPMCIANPRVRGAWEP